MASIFNALSIGYSGLNAAQVGINTTGHNITNANTAGYTRQRAIQTAQTPLFSGAGNVGNGTQIQDIARVFDNYVYDRYTNISAKKEFTQFSKQTLNELSTYFPEIAGVGIKSDLAQYYNMWQTFADNPNNAAIKVALAKQTDTLTQHIAQTQNQVKSLQSQLNDKLKTNVDQVNKLAGEVAALNKSIDTAEAGNSYTASDLRDRRNLLEKNLAQLIGSKVNQGQIQANIQIDSNSNTRTGSYTLSVNGFNIVDGGTYHPINISNKSNPNGFYQVSYERQDGVLIPMEESITGGKIGAIFDLRGKSIDTTTGVPKNGIVQNTIAQLDAFANGLIQTTNNLYAASSNIRMNSNPQTIDGKNALVSSNLNIKQGTFDLVIYDINGNETARRSITIDATTSMTGVINSNSIQGQILAKKDDNADGNANNDINSFMTFNYQTSADGILRLELGLDPAAESKGYTFSLKDTLKTTNYASGTNFAGALGLGRYFDGNSASNIQLASSLKNNSTGISAGYSGTAGDSRVALNMVQQQFEKYDYKVGTDTYNTTSYGMFDITSTYVGIETNTAISKNDTTTTQFNAVQLEYTAVSKVNVDEELTNLIKYQTSYGASAKLITTIDKMMQTLLGIKQ